MKNTEYPEKFFISDNNDMLDDPLFDLYTGYCTAGRMILPAKYKGVESLNAMILKQNHLTTKQKRKLLQTFQGHDCLFEGKLGCYSGKRYTWI